MYGTWTKLFVPDVKYRSDSIVSWSNSNTDISEITNFSKSGTFISKGTNADSIITPIPTDDELQSILGTSYSDQSAKTCTDAIISSIGSSTSYAAGLARSCYISGLGYMDLPTLYEMMVIWCESDNIDNIDPTAENYPSLKLGYTNPYGRFYIGNNQSYGRIWTSSKDDSNYSWSVRSSSYIAFAKKTTTYYSVVPVKEL